MFIHFVLYPLLLALIVFLAYRWQTSVAKTKADVFALFLAGAKETRLQWFSTLNTRAETIDILFLGDSLIQEWQVGEMFPALRTANRGIGGITSHGVLDHFDEIAGPLRPRMLVLLVGTNDFTQPVYNEETTARNIAAIIKAMKKAAPATRCHVLSVPPVGKKSAPGANAEAIGPRENGKIRSLNERIRTLVAEEAIYHDLHVLLRDAEGFLEDVYTREGLHLSPSAYEKLTAYIEKEIIKKQD